MILWTARLLRQMLRQTAARELLVRLMLASMRRKAHTSQRTPTTSAMLRSLLVPYNRLESGKAVS
jgi:hypothetical protein